MNFRNKKDSVCANIDVKKLRIAIPGGMTRFLPKDSVINNFPIFNAR